MTPKKKHALPPRVRRQFAEWGSGGGKKAAKQMTKAQRIARAKKAVTAREAKRF